MNILNDSVNILHLSDIHSKQIDTDYLQMMTKALLHDVVEELGLPIDAVVISGDVAFSGKDNQFQLAAEQIVKPLCRGLGIAPERVIFCPGNHDVDRDVIDLIAESALRNGLESKAAEHLLRNDSSFKRLQAYFAFLESHYSRAPEDMSLQLHSLTAKGVRMVFASLNSAWQCLDDSDEGKLFVTELPLMKAGPQIAAADIRVGVMHHPLDWLHASEHAVVVPDLKQSFDVILTGHLHEPCVLAEAFGDGECILLQAPAFFHDRFDAGYNLYQFSANEAVINVLLRSFKRKRRAFDADTDRARGGTRRFNLPTRSFERFPKKRLVMQVAATQSELADKIKSQLRRYQTGAEPTYVKPPLKRVRSRDGERGAIEVVESLSSSLERLNILYGPSETGKTVLLEATTSEINELVQGSDAKRIACYRDLGSQPLTRALLDGLLAEALPTDLAQQGARIVLFLDDMSNADLESFKVLRQFVSENETVDAVASVSNQLMFDSLLATYPAGDFAGFELGYWGPSRIRQMAEHAFAGAEIDVNVAFNWIVDSLKNSDLVATPVVVCIYLSVFPSLGGRVSSLSFLRLLEKYEELRLSGNQESTSVSLYHLQRILSAIASEMFRRRTHSLELQDYGAEITGYFAKRKIPFDGDEVMVCLLNSGLLEVTESGQFAFAGLIIYDYYIARALEHGVLELEQETSSLPQIARLGDALALYAGLRREDADLALAMLDKITGDFHIDRELSLQDIDTMIDGLMFPDELSENVDEVTKKELDTVVDYKKQDETFDKEQKDYKQTRLNELRRTAEQPLGRLTLLLSSLTAFYKIFRNLEGIDGSHKTEMLEKILDYHIECIVVLMTFFFGLVEESRISIKEIRRGSRKFKPNVSQTKTMFGYLAALGSQGLLNSNMGNQSLQLAIEEVLEVTENDVKQLTLLLLLCHLRAKGWEDRVRKFIPNTKSITAVEMVLWYLRHSMQTHSGPNIPAALVTTFKAAWNRRAVLAKVGSGPEGQRQLETTLQEIKRGQLTFQFLNDPLAN